MAVELSCYLLKDISGYMVASLWPDSTSHRVFITVPLEKFCSCQSIHKNCETFLPQTTYFYIHGLNTNNSL